MSAPDRRRARERGRRERRSAARRTLALSGALLILVLVSVSALAPLLQGTGWWADASLAVTVVLGSAALFRLIGTHPALGTLVGAAAGVVLMVLLSAPSTGLLFMIPTADTVTVFAEIASQGVSSIQQQSTPAIADHGIRFLVSSGAIALAVSVDLVGVAVRQPAVVGALVAAVAVVPGLVTNDVVIWPLALCALAYLFVLWVDTRLKQGSANHARGALAVGATAVVASLVLAAAAPGFNGAGLMYAPSGQVALQGISPLVDLGRDLRQPGGIEQFRYITDTTRPLYFRLLTLDRFDGTTWSPSEDRITEEHAADEVLSVPGLESATPTEPVETRIDISGMRSSWLPVPFPSVQVTGVDGRWEWDVEGLTLSSSVSSTAGQEYVATSEELSPTREQLIAAPASYPAEAERFLELPEDMPEIIGETLDEVIGETSNRYDAASALQRFFREDGGFLYSEEAPVEQGYDGDGYGVIATFLEQRSGYCVHFASAMAIMSRLAGIPARVSLGYLPGDRLGSTDDGRGRYAVETEDLHAWPELYFDGVGWIPFEPTAGRGVVPEYAREIEEQQQQDEIPQRTGSSTSTPAATVPAETEDETTAAPEEAAEEAPVIVGWAFALVALVLFSLPATIRLWRSRSRARLLRSGRQGAPVAWTMLEDHARDLGLGSGRTETPRAFAAGLAERVPMRGGEAEALRLLLDAVERDRFAVVRSPIDGRALADAVRAVNRALTRYADRIARIRAVLLPASVLSPRQPAPVASEPVAKA